MRHSSEMKSRRKEEEERYKYNNKCSGAVYLTAEGVQAETTVMSSRATFPVQTSARSPKWLFSRTTFSIENVSLTKCTFENMFRLKLSG